MIKRKSIFPYPGSKWRMMPTILKLLPDHDHYVVPFGGSGTEILAKVPSKLESFNDRDELIYNLFNVIVRGDRHELRRRVAETPDRCKKFFNEARSILQRPITDPVESAWAFLVSAHNGYTTAHAALSTDGNWAYERLVPKSRWPGLTKAIDYVARRFKHVRLFNHDWESIVERLDTPRTAFVLDPPYPPDIVKGVKKFYRHTLSVPQHETMLKRLLAVKGYVVLCGYDHPLYDDYLKDWRVVRVATFKSMVVNGQRPRAEEVLWLNYQPDGTRIR